MTLYVNVERSDHGRDYGLIEWECESPDDEQFESIIRLSYGGIAR